MKSVNNTGSSSLTLRVGIGFALHLKGFVVSRSWLPVLCGSFVFFASAVSAAEDLTDQILFPKKEAVVRIDAKTTATALEILAPCFMREIEGTKLQVHTTKGRGWVERNQMLTSDEAIAYSKSLIERSKPDPYGLFVRAALFNQNEAADKALADLTAAIKLDPQFAMAFTTRGWLHVEKGDLDKALADFTAATKLAPKAALPANNLAWFRATCPDSKFRDGKQAITLATLACEQTGYKHEEFLDTLAAAHAEAGDFKAAVKWATKTLELDPQNEDFAEHLKLYQGGKPLRDEVK